MDLTADEMTNKFTILIMDLMHRFIPNQMIRCDDRDPPWITPKLKTAIKRKHRVYNKYVKRGRKPDEWEYVRQVRNETSAMITNSKDNYFAELGHKLSNPNNGPKTYWTILNRIINKKKTMNIPPLLENGLFVTNFQTKADIFEGLIFKLKSNGISGPLLVLIDSYLSNRKQRVVLNGKSSNWSPISAGVPQGSVLGPLFFLVYINDLVENVSSDAKLFADDTSLFAVVYDEGIAADQLNRDLKVISDWAYQWKMQFNPDKNKQAIQVIFSQKRTKPVHPPIFLNESEVMIKDEQKHLGMILDSRLNFNSHVREKIISARRGIGVIRYLSKYVSRDVLDQMYKLYVRPHLDYGDIIYHKHDPDLKLDFTKKLESTQYSAALAVSGAWRGTSRQKLYDELGWESLYHRRWYRRMTHFYKLRSTRSPLYLYNLIPPERDLNYNLRIPYDYDQHIERTTRFSHTYFQNCVREWNRLDVSMRLSQTISEFKRKFLKLIRPPKRSIFNIYDLEGIKLLTQLRVEFSDLRYHRYRHNFHCTSPTCLCQTGIEDNEHFLLHCPRFSLQRRPLLQLASNSADVDIMRLSSNELTNVLLYGYSKFTVLMNRTIIEATLKYIKSTGRFKRN